MPAHNTENTGKGGERGGGGRKRAPAGHDCSSSRWLQQRQQRRQSLAERRRDRKEMRCLCLPPPTCQPPHARVDEWDPTLPEPKKDPRAALSILLSRLSSCDGLRAYWSLRVFFDLQAVASWQSVRQGEAAQTLATESRGSVPRSW